MNLKSIIPSMTSDTSPSPFVISASSYYQSDLPYKAFNGILGSTTDRHYWYVYGTMPSSGHWLRVDTGVGQSHKVVRYSVRGTVIGYRPKSWFLEGSNNGSSWIILDTRNDYTLDSNVKNHNYFDIAEPNHYRYYRMRITKSENISNNLEVSSLELFELAYTRLNFLKNTTTGRHYSIDTSINSLIEITDLSLDSFEKRGIWDSTSVNVSTIPNFYSTVGENFEVVTYNALKDTPSIFIEYTHSERKLTTSLDVLLLGVESIKRIASTSSSNPLTALSFDNGYSWLSYENGNWTTVADAHQGMSVNTLNGIPESALNQVRGESNYIKFQHSFGNGDVINSFRMYVDFKGSDSPLSTNYYDYTYNSSQLAVTLKEKGNFSIVYTDVDA